MSSHRLVSAVARAFSRSTRGARMAPADFLIGLGMVAKRLYPEERAQSAAFHRLLADQMLPWMLQLQHALASQPLH